MGLLLLARPLSKNRPPALPENVLETRRVAATRKKSVAQRVCLQCCCRAPAPRERYESRQSRDFFGRQAPVEHCLARSEAGKPRRKNSFLTASTAIESGD
jgi:hypothetical protein